MDSKTPDFAWSLLRRPRNVKSQEEPSTQSLSLSGDENSETQTKCCGDKATDRRADREHFASQRAFHESTLTADDSEELQH